MRDGIDSAVAGDHDVISDDDIAISVDQGIRAYPAVVTNGNFAPVGIDQHVLFNAGAVTNGQCSVTIGICPEYAVPRNSALAADSDPGRVFKMSTTFND
jgi:hypothetical protein